MRERMTAERKRNELDVLARPKRKTEWGEQAFHCGQ